MALKRLRVDEVGFNHIVGARLANLRIVSESSLYRLIMQSDKREAEAFRDWVTRDVLPAIRKDGGIRR